MDGFKNSTRTQYMKGGSCEGYAKGGSVKGAAKISKVMGEFKAGTLHSGSKNGPEVTSKKQATAIALSEARKAGAKIPQPVQKKAIGGAMAARAAARAATTVGGAKAPVRKVAAPVRGPGGAGFAAKPMVSKPDVMKPMVSKPDVSQPLVSKPDVSQPMVSKPDVMKPLVGKPVTMKHGGKVMKKGNGGRIARSMMESTSARPQKIGPTPEEKAGGAAVARGNRIAREEASEAKIARMAAPKDDFRARHGIEIEKTTVKRIPADAVDRERAAKPTRGPAGRTYTGVPLIDRAVDTVRRATGLKQGGLAAMPKGKKC